MNINKPLCCTCTYIGNLRIFGQVVILKNASMYVCGMLATLGKENDVNSAVVKTRALAQERNPFQGSSDTCHQVASFAWYCVEGRNENA